MHPILSQRSRFGPYLVATGLLGCLLAGVLAGARGLGWRAALLIAVPLVLVYGFMCLAAWYPCRATPLATAGALRLAATHLLAATATAGLWLFLAEIWVRLLAATGRPALASTLQGGRLFVLALGIVLYLLAVALHYLVIAFEASRRAEVASVELEVLAREAELRALRAQINPHFLFNSLNSVSALIGSDPAAARRMCQLLADFFRQSLRLGSREAIPLADELALVANYLEIERVRFGSRLQVGEAVSDAARGCLVPPLLLQPLVENAVVHGIAQLVAGGAVRCAADVVEGPAGDLLRITIENPSDPDRPPSRGAGVGLANVRGRLQRLHGSRGTLHTEATADRFRVEILMPATPRDEVPAEQREVREVPAEQRPDGAAGAPR